MTYLYKKNKRILNLNLNSLALKICEKMSDGENVKVAVRVRPFNTREKDAKSKLVVAMSGYYDLDLQKIT